VDDCDVLFVVDDECLCWEVVDVNVCVVGDDVSCSDDDLWVCDLV